MSARTRTQLDHARRIARVIAHIAGNVDRPPTLDAMAAIAAFSPYHFHRVYRAVAGETPADTLLRARMGQAAVALLRTERPIAAIAQAVGYGSAAAFTRAFTVAHGIPPGAYRARGGFNRGHRAAPTQQEQSMPYDVTFREEPALRLAALSHVGRYDRIGGTFDRLNAWATPRGLAVPDARWIGLYYDDPGTVPAEACRAEAGVTVGPTVEGDDEVHILDLPATRVAVLRFRGPYAEIDAAYDWLYRVWLPNSGEEPADMPGREDYVSDPRETPPADLLTDIMLPLRPERAR